MPGVTYITQERPEGNGHILAHPESGSWARALGAGATAPFAVVEKGPRSLWTELTEIAEAWVGAGRQPVSAYGLSVAADGEHALWIGSPKSYRWLLG